MANQMRAIHHEETLNGELEELSLSANIFAKALGVPTPGTAILNEQRAIAGQNGDVVCGTPKLR